MANTRFDTFEVALELIASLKPLAEQVALHDRDLAAQLKRAASSIPLNIAEVARRVGRDRLHAYRIAAGSVAEVRASLAVAKAWAYVAADAFAAVEALLERVLAMLWRLTNPRP